jgi:hypothetical protein
MVYFLCALLVSTVCFKYVLIFGNQLLHNQGFSEAHVRSGTGYYFLQLFADSLLSSCLSFLVNDVSEPHGGTFMLYNGSFTQYLVLYGHIHDSERYSWPGSD